MKSTMLSVILMDLELIDMQLKHRNLLLMGSIPMKFLTDRLHILFKADEIVESVEYEETENVN